MGFTRSAVLLAACAVPATAQCTFDTTILSGVPGTNGPNHALATWDPDGPGPIGARVVFGGNFTLAGAIHVANVAALDPATQTWSSLGGGVNGIVRAAAGLPNGNLVIGGDFTLAGGVAAAHIAIWNGSTWSAFAGATDASVRALAVATNGDLIAGGGFSTIGGVPAAGIARWNGVSWSPFGSGLGSKVTCIAALANGDVVAGGWFHTATGEVGDRIARWNGTAWLPVGAGIGVGQWSSDQVNALAEWNGEIFVGGRFSLASGVPVINVARWDGSSWSSIGGAPGFVNSLLARSADLTVGGSFQAPGVNARGIALWNGTSWTLPGGGLEGDINALASLPTGELVVAGNLGIYQGQSAIWNGSHWAPPGGAFKGTVLAATTLGNGDIVVGGTFTHSGVDDANYVARWDGAVWRRLGSAATGQVLDLATLPNGDLVAAGAFTLSSGPQQSIARWDGTAWLPLGTGVEGLVSALRVLPNGDLIVGGAFTTAGGAPALHVARWNGSSWSALGAGIPTAVGKLAILSNGDLVAATGGAMSRWDGAAWLPFSVGSSVPISAFAALPNGGLLAAGNFPIGSGFPVAIARWDGATWLPVPSGVQGTYAMLPLPNGDVLSGTTFSSPMSRWNGTAFLHGTPAVPLTRTTWALAAMPDGRIVTAGGYLEGTVALLTPTCPATATVLGGGCVGSAGPTALAATSLPWIGSTVHGEGTGMPATSLVLSVFGFATTPAIPVGAVWPVGVPGCNQHITVDFIDVLLPVAGTASSRLQLPNTAALVGVTFHQQMFPFEFDVASNLIAVLATNAISMTIGSL